jgi:hypothetical protein
METEGIDIFARLSSVLVVYAWLLVLLWAGGGAFVRHAVADLRRMRQQRAEQRRGFDVISRIVDRVVRGHHQRESAAT